MLRIFVTTSFAICCFSSKTFCQDKDTVILYNGQVLIGAVQGANLGVISIDDIDLKMQNIKMYKIKKLIILERFKIEMVYKRILYGSLKTSGKDGWVDIFMDGGERIPIQITQIFHLI